MMVLKTEEFPVDTDELKEALALLKSWEGRFHTLPMAIQLQGRALADQPEGELLRLEHEGGHMVLDLKPEVRAFIALLRVHEPA